MKTCRSEARYIYIDMVVTHPDLEPLAEQDMDELNDALVELVEQRGLCIGGTMRLTDEEDDEDV